MRRRAFIAGLGSAAAWPLAARAQQPAAMPTIGFLAGGSSDLVQHRLRAFREGLSESGYAESQNVRIEFRWAHSQSDRLPALAADLVRQSVAVIVAGGMPAVLAAKGATTTIPIVFSVGDQDPVISGLVASLNRPGGNLTGVSNLNVELAPKRLQLLHEVVPAAIAVALLVNPTNPNAETLSMDLQATARALGLQLHPLPASRERDFGTVFAALRELRAGALLIGADPFFTLQSEHLAALALRHATPAIFQFREFAAAGGLMSYGGSLTNAYRQAGVYAGRVLKGEKAADLPVQQTTKIELIINLKTAKALGIEVPPSLLARADEVIE